MDFLKTFKALSNQQRLDILKWLDEPEAHFPEQQQHVPAKKKFKDGVCVGDIQTKSDLCQSTISDYLAMMEEAGLLQSKRLGQWTYYRRDEKAIKQIFKSIEQEI